MKSIPNSLPLTGGTWQESVERIWKDTRRYLIASFVKTGVPVGEHEELLADANLLLCRNVARLHGTGRPLHLPMLAKAVIYDRALAYKRHLVEINRPYRRTPPESTPVGVVIRVMVLLALLLDHERQLCRVYLEEDGNLVGMARNLGVSVAAARRRLERLFAGIRERLSVAR